MLCRTLKFIGFFAFAAAFSCLSLNAQEYDIKLERPFKIGDKYKISYHETLTTVKEVTQKERGPSKGRGEASVTASYEGKVLELSPEGLPAKEEILVRSFESCKGGQSMEMIPSGTCLIASLQDGKAVFQLDGADVPEQTAKMLRKASLIGNLGDERVFKMSGKRKLGETWEPNMEAISKLFAQSGRNPGALSASSSLNKLEKAGGRECLALSAQVRSELPGSAPSAPKKNEMTITIDWLLPLDAPKHVVSKKSSQKIYARQVFREVETVTEMTAESETTLEE